MEWAPFLPLQNEITFELQRARKEIDVVYCHLYVGVWFTTQVLISIKDCPSHVWQNDKFQKLWIREVKKLSDFALLSRYFSWGNRMKKKELTQVHPCPPPLSLAISLCSRDSWVTGYTSLLLPCVAIVALSSGKNKRYDLLRFLAGVKYNIWNSLPNVLKRFCPL